MTVWNSVIAEGDAFLENVQYSPEEMKAYLDQFRAVYCAAIGTEIAGVCLLRKLYLGKGSHVAEVIYAVKFSFRRMGIGTKMMTHSVQTARELGFASVAGTRVSGANPAAMNFLTKSGFTPAGEIPKGFRREKIVKTGVPPQPEEKKGLKGLAKIFDKKEAEVPLEKTVVEYSSLYTYLKPV
jgi:GNAT superfamily N-acetyltransferase